ncbi:DUF922 domain-containing protein [Aureitalea marina]|uniref:DUF922 domain-containing protein n=1 Tax=Aureitalea marina TaxID=930804 RepID=A0A2S7KQ72_9FLAO|nr:DUF922 domain-containing protein [Aureitalea marina]PQB04761.1 hypothetical protein BST85_07525 [Aureitalea marina]
MKFLVLTILLFLPNQTPTGDEDKILWSEERKLTWEDFRGTPQSWGTYVASTSSGISFSYSIGVRGGQLDLKYSVESNFYPQSSWYNPDEVNDYILRHEQTHFDISELHARIFRKVLSETAFDLDPQDELSDLYEEVEQARRAMQQLYDKETDHSNIREAEERWVRYVGDRMAEFERWR